MEEKEKIQRDLPFNNINLSENKKIKFLLPQIDNLNLPENWVKAE